MQIKLFFQEYEVKMTLGAMKYYKGETGRDLWSDILGYSAVFIETEGMEVNRRLHRLTEFLGFNDAAILFHSMIRSCNSSIPLSEIEDAMFHVGPIPSERDHNMSEPWPIELMVLANMINKEITDFTKKKKSADIEH